MAEASTVTDLLNKLGNEHKEITWRIRCTYADGLGKSYHEIQLFWVHTPQKMKILFQMDTGEILPFGCSGVSTTGSENIIDFLLDLINYENAIS